MVQPKHLFAPHSFLQDLKKYSIFYYPQSILKKKILFFLFTHPTIFGIVYSVGEMMTNKQITHDGKVKVSLNFDPNLLLEIEEERKERGLTRSAWFNIAAMYYLQKNKKEEKIKQK